MIYDESRKLGGYNRASTDQLPEISPQKYSPTMTTQGGKAGIG